MHFAHLHRESVRDLPGGGSRGVHEGVNFRSWHRRSRRGSVQWFAEGMPRSLRPKAQPFLRSPEAEPLVRGESREAAAQRSLWPPEGTREHFGATRFRRRDPRRTTGADPGTPRAPSVLNAHRQARKRAFALPGSPHKNSVKPTFADSKVGFYSGALLAGLPRLARGALPSNGMPAKRAPGLPSRQKARRLPKLHRKAV